MEMLYAVETHLHTSQASACAYSTGAQMARAHKDAGYSAIVITDHFFGGNTAVPRDLPWKERIDLFCAGYEDAKRVGDRIGLNVFFGLEWAWNATEFLTYGLDKEYLYAHPQMEQWDIPTYLTNVRAAGAYIIHAHPYRKAEYIPDVRLFPEYVDAAEVYNCGNTDMDFNRKAMAYAKKHDLAMTSGSDGHDHLKMRGGGMRFATQMNTIEDLIRAVRTRQPFEIMMGEKEQFLY